MSNLLIFDGTYFLYRSYHAMPPLSTSDGRPTGALKGAINALQSLMRNIQPDCVVAVFDGNEKTFRHELYPAYKGNRPPRPEELKAQFDPLLKLVNAMGIKTVITDGYNVEADDLIGTFAVRAAAADFEEVLIATGDKDMAQLVNKTIRLYNPYSTNFPVMGEEEVIAKFGVRPNQIIDFLALIGDTADNIIGLRGVGPKTAAGWLRQYGTLDTILNNTASLPEKFRSQVESSKEQLLLNQKLTTIKTDVETPYALLTDFETKPFDVSLLMDLFEDLEFNDSLFRG